MNPANMMNKKEFLTTLAQNLRKMRGQERERFITFYDELLSDYMESGMSEEAALRKVGNPDDIAQEILAEADTLTLPIPQVHNKYLFTILLIISFPLWGCLLLAFLLLLLSIYLAFFCIPFATGLGAIAFLSASLVSIVGSPFIMGSSLTAGLTQLGLGIASLGIAALLAFATIPIARSLFSHARNLTVKSYQAIRESVK